MKTKAGIKTKRILVPIDLQKCPFEVFARVNAYAEGSEVTVILLHVVNLNIASPENRIFQELAQEAHRHLERLARENIHPSASVLIRIRFGNPMCIPGAPGVLPLYTRPGDRESALAGAG